MKQIFFICTTFCFCICLQAQNSFAVEGLIKGLPENEFCACKHIQKQKVVHIKKICFIEL